MVKSKATKKNPVNIVVTGHSLGGAMATLASAEVAKICHLESEVKGLCKLKALVTFGSPKVFNAPATIWFNNMLKSIGASSNRYTFDKDPVP